MRKIEGMIIEILVGFFNFLKMMGFFDFIKALLVCSLF